MLCIGAVGLVVELAVWLVLLACLHVWLAVCMAVGLHVGLAVAWLLAWLLAKTMYYMYAHTKAFSLCRPRTAANVPLSCGKYVLWTWSTCTVRFLPAQTAVSPPRRRRGGGGEEKKTAPRRGGFFHFSPLLTKIKLPIHHCSTAFFHKLI